MRSEFFFPKEFGSKFLGEITSIGFLMVYNFYYINQGCKNFPDSIVVDFS